MMFQRYSSLDDLWCEWGNATTAIMKHIEVNEPLASNRKWIFDEGYVVRQHPMGYSVSIIQKAFDSNISQMVLLSVQANVNNDGDISVKTVKRASLKN